MEEVDRAIPILAKWADGKKVGPQRVLIYPTNKCNLSCKFCYQQLNPYDVSKDLPHERWLELTKELCDIGVQTVQISGGGEPMIIADTVIGMMSIIKENGVAGRLVNNGTLWNKENVRKVIELGWNQVIFSLDGENHDTHNYLRGRPDAFQRTTEAIEWFRDFKKEKNTEVPRLELSSVVTNRNFKQASGIVKLAHELGIKVITFEPVFVSNPFVHKLKLSQVEREEYMTKYVPRAHELAQGYGMITNLHTLVDLKVLEKTGNLKDDILETGKDDDTEILKGNIFTTMPCFEPWLWPKIEADGRVGPCSTNMLKGVNLKDRTFTEVWFGKEFTQFRKRIRKGDLPDGCENCVSTHVPMNKRIREKLIRYLEKREI